ncbi:PAS domain-containing sensor histidine kinase [Pontibacter ramchanderi]|uniref:PAS domain-containing sensor histidine kinase n=1 Tax=Pontibacter ramchanderi TaxID=1179743 RepID=UPI0015D60B02|nr:PAS domain-containing sensor histidine kinase [Pontibacter ramchanderi]
MFQYNLTQQQFDYLSPAFHDLWDMDEARLQKSALQLLDTVVEDDRPAVLRCWHKLLKGDHVDEIVRVQQHGRLRHIRYIVYPICNAAQKVVAVAGMAENVTRQQDFINYLAEFGQRKDSVLEIVSHDLRGPLAVVKSVAGLIRREVHENTRQEIEHYTDIIEKACIQCTDLIQDLLSEEHLRSPEVYVHKTRVDLNDQIRNVAELYQKGQMVQQQFILQLPQEPLMLELDQIKFSQIMNNLISNSIKFTPKEGSITIRAFQEGDEAVVEHSDTGIGIPEHLLSKLFERRGVASRQGLNGEESRGLGLSIVYELVRLQGGSIEVQSNGQHGTCFTVRLPLYAD